jgi:hypothetical protein
MPKIVLISAFAAMLALAAHDLPNRARGADPDVANAAAQPPANPVQTAPEPPVRDYFEQLQRDQAAADAALRAANAARQRALGVTDAPAPTPPTSPPAPAPIPRRIEAPSGGESNRAIQFTDQAGRFGIVMPGQPKYWTQKDASGAPTTQAHLSIDQMEYQAAFRDLPPEDASDLDRTFHVWQDWALKKVNGRSERLRRRVIVKHDAIEFEIVLPDNRHWIGWFFVVGNRLYQVNILGPGLTGDHPTVRAFINSFQLLESPSN